MLGRGALALFRHVPGIHPGWHRIGLNLDQFREYSWSRRVLEYLPLAGFVGLGLRHRPAAAFFGWLLADRDPVHVRPRADTCSQLTLALVPGYATYALLTASIVLPSRAAAPPRPPRPRRLRSRPPQQLPAILDREPESCAKLPGLSYGGG